MAQGGMEDHTRRGQVEPGIFCKGSKMQFEKLALTTVQTGWERGELQGNQRGARLNVIVCKVSSTAPTGSGSLNNVSTLIVSVDPVVPTHNRLGLHPD